MRRILYGRLMARQVVGVLVALIACCTLVAPAHAKIVVGKSAGGIAIGASTSAVTQEVGKPSKRTCRKLFVSDDVKAVICDLIYRKRKLQIQTTEGRVSSVLTTSSKERTAKGIGPGSHRARVKKAYPKCRETEFYCGMKSSEGVVTTFY